MELFHIWVKVEGGWFYQCEKDCLEELSSMNIIEIFIIIAAFANKRFLR